MTSLRLGIYRPGADGVALPAVDGIFGAQTEAWVREFQRRSAISVDGIVGPVTRAKLANSGITL